MLKLAFPGSALFHARVIFPITLLSLPSDPIIHTRSAMQVMISGLVNLGLYSHTCMAPLEAFSLLSFLHRLFLIEYASPVHSSLVPLPLKEPSSPRV
jgi:hypothetical protein